MKYLVLCFIGVTIIGVIYGFFFASPGKITNYPPNGTSVVAFGDSLVEGVGSSAGNDFVSLLEHDLDEPIVNLGVRGDTTRSALQRLDHVFAQDPKIVLVLLGGNDYLQQIPKEETFANLNQMVTDIHDFGAVVILLGVRGGLLTDGYKNEYEDLAQSLGAAYVPDVLDGLLGNAALMSDAVHPNDAGYKIIADKITPTLADLLE